MCCKLITRRPYRAGAFSCAVLLLLAALPGCRSARAHREQADKVAYQAVQDAQRQALGTNETFTIERPSDALRRRLLIEQNLPISSKASLGADQLPAPEHWPDPTYSATNRVAYPQEKPVITNALQLSLADALHIAAQESREYQDQKESVFAAALALDLQRNSFRSQLESSGSSRFSHNRGGDEPVDTAEHGASASLARTLATGAQLTGQLAVDLAQLLTGERVSSVGLVGDVSLSVPLLRGAGRHIVRESLTQAERNALYAVLKFEEYKRSFAVEVASQYFAVLTSFDRVKNAIENYDRQLETASRAASMARAGRLPEIQVDQAHQDLLRARNGRIAAEQEAEQQVDSLKLALGLPADARIALDRSALDDLVTGTTNRLEGAINSDALKLPPDPIEMPPDQAVRIALRCRPDMDISKAQIEDAQRAVAIAADGLRAELTLLGSASAGEGRSGGSADQPNAKLDPGRGAYSALLTIDLPTERTAERNAYRKSLIALEAAVRDTQAQEDRIKSDVRGRLRTLSEQRENIAIQVRSVALARRRQHSSNLFLQAGRAQIRDLLEAQDALLSAENALTSAVVSYHIGRLRLQRDLGLLQVGSDGLYQEMSPDSLKEALLPEGIRGS